MRLQPIQPHPLLAPHLEKIWLFESEMGLPPGDLRTVVPNGRPKLIIPYHGRLVSTINNQQWMHVESSITLVGMMEAPVIIDSAGAIGAIGIEFKAASAYRFLNLDLKHITNAVYRLDDVLGRLAHDLQQRIEAVAVGEKIRLVQQFLLERLTGAEDEDRLVTRAVSAIQSSGGLVRINDLCAELGYSKRYLDMKFAAHIGLSPKMLARIVRFQQFYQSWSDAPADIYDHYYDQAHFIKEFKLFTGYAPGVYRRQINDFGRIFYRRR